MANEKFTLTWHSYASHFKEVLGNLFDTGESSDVTLVCDDQVKFKAHKFILKSCSPVFESILNETNDSKSLVYLRGVNQLELKPILSFIYSGQASFHKERMKEFLKIGKELQIKEIKEMPEEDEMADNGEDVVDKTQQDLILEEVAMDDTDVPSYSSQYPPCNSVFKHRSALLKHVRNIHEGVSYPCKQCDYKAKHQSNLKKHMKSVHEGMKYPCGQCVYKATRPDRLKIHIESVHEGVIYPCSHCNYKASQQSNLKRHIELKHWD